MTSFKIQTLVSAVIAIAAMGCEQNFASESFEFDRSITSLSVNTDFGDVHLQMIDSRENVRVAVDIECRSSVPDYDVYVNDNHLIFDLDADFGASACEGDLTLMVPAETAIDIRTGRGDIVVDDLQGAMKLVTFDGNVVLNNVRGDFDATAVSGDIEGVRIASKETRLTVGVGNVDLTYAVAPIVADIHLSAGNANVVLPLATYNVEARSDVGQVDIDGVRQDLGADHSLLLDVETGDISIHAQ